MSKKTIADLACEELGKHGEICHRADGKNCLPYLSKNKFAELHCDKCWYQYFQQQAKKINSKKSALRLACEKLADCCEMPPYTDCYKTWADAWEQYFQQQADILDGWEVVKEIFKLVCNSMKKNIKDGEIKITKEFSELDHIGKFIYSKLQQAEIEVKQ